MTSWADGFDGHKRAQRQSAAAATTTEGRDTHRAAHRAWLADLLEKKTLVSSGPFADDSGALLKMLEDLKTEVQTVKGITQQVFEAASKKK